MFKVSNIRKETDKNWVYLKCDIDVTGMNSPFAEKTIWMAVEPNMGGVDRYNSI